MSFRCIQKGKECELDSVPCGSEGDPYLHCVNSGNCQEDSTSANCQQALQNCNSMCGYGDNCDSCNYIKGMEISRIGMKLASDGTRSYCQPNPMAGEGDCSPADVQNGKCCFIDELTVLPPYPGLTHASKCQAVNPMCQQVIDDANTLGQDYVNSDCCGTPSSESKGDADKKVKHGEDTAMIGFTIAMGLIVLVIFYYVFKE